MANITPITRDLARPIDTPQLGHFGIISDYIAVVDGRGSKLLEAEYQARQIIELRPDFQTVSIITESRTLAQSNMAVECAHVTGTVITHHSDGALQIYKPQSAASSLGSAHIHPDMAQKIIGPDFVNIFAATSQVFPEYMSWDIRTKGSKYPGICHFDGAYDEAVLDPTEDLSLSFLMAADEMRFKKLQGSITITVALNEGGTLVTKNTGAGFVLNELEDISQGIHVNEIDAPFYQTQNGDITIMRGRGWSGDFVPTAHSSVLHSRKRNAAVLSSFASYLHPHVLDEYGPFVAAA